MVRGIRLMMNHLLFFNKIIILISTLYKSKQLMRLDQLKHNLINLRVKKFTDSIFPIYLLKYLTHVVHCTASTIQAGTCYISWNQKIPLSNYIFPLLLHAMTSFPSFCQGRNCFSFLVLKGSLLLVFILLKHSFPLTQLLSSA